MIDSSEKNAMPLKDKINKALELDPKSKIGFCLSATPESWQFVFPDSESMLSWIPVAQRVANQMDAKIKTSATPKLKRVDGVLQETGINYYGYIFWDRA